MGNNKYIELKVLNIYIGVINLPKRGGKRIVLVKGAEKAMEAFKMEVAQELGFNVESPDDFKKLTTETVGIIGGTMVRRIQAAGEYAIMQRFNKGEKHLMPEDILPAPGDVRDISNNGNNYPQLQKEQLH